MKVIQYIKINHLFNRVAFASGVILTLLAIAIHLPIISNGEQETQAATNQEESITVDITNPTASVELIVDNSDGTFATSANSERASFAVSTSSNSGYTLSISSNDDSGELISGENSFSSIGSAISPSAFDTTTYNGKWGYLPSKYNSISNTNFLPSPTTEESILDVTESANIEANSYTIALGARADFVNNIGSYNKTFILTSVANFMPNACDPGKLCVEYEGNGLIYDNDETVNNVNYDSVTTTVSDTKYSHTANIDDAGVQSGTYDKSLKTKDVVSIPGASSLHAVITYQTNRNDRLYVFTGEYTGSIGSSTTGYYKRYYGTTKTTVEIDITGDTATFGFYSASSGTKYYGYYAVVTGTGTSTERTVYSGEYAAPNTTNSQIFHGWSSTQTTAGAGLPSNVEYAGEDDVMDNIPGDNGDVATVYAVWQQGYPIAFTFDNNVANITVRDSGNNVVGVINESGQELTLYNGNTYTINPTYNTGYVADTITKTSGEGTLNGKEFTAGAGAATINIASKPLEPMQNWTGCSSLAVGDTEQVYDTRDNEVYLVGKLADNKCWLLDNLRFDIVAHKDDISSANTNAGDGTINYLKGITTRDPSTDAGGNYATAGVSYWTSSYSYSAPLIAIKNASNDNWNPDTTTTSYGSGSGKIGVYYNYCAASAGSYCFSNGDNSGTSEGDAGEDICPAGWRMPTGGSSGEYQALYTAYSSDDTNFINALSTPLSGEFYGGSADLQGTYSFFWSSSRYSNGSMHGLYVEPSDVAPQDFGTRGHGYSVRCLLQMPAHSITFNMDSNVSSIAVLDSTGDTVGTITSSGQSISLYEADTYTIKPTYTTGYVANTITKTSGAGTLNGKEFTVGAGAATISVTSKVMQPMQNWTGCSSLAVGDTEQVYDTRDNEVYLVGKLADDKCWMLDNLRFDIVAHKDDISSANTNITNSATLTSLKSGNRNAGNNYATAGVSYWGTDDDSYSVPLIAIKNASDDAWNPNTTTTSYGSGSGKIGVYYNFCAASAGSYCYGDGTSEGTSSGNATEDICPAGWRMPTGGSSGEYQALATTITGETGDYIETTDLQTALSTPLSGLFGNGSASNQGTYGYFWSSTRLNGSNMYILYVGSYAVSPQDYSGRVDGNSVRCLLQ